jgi:DNA-binding MarR family transcriptional regulator
MDPSPDEFREAASLRGALRKFMRSSERIAREEGLTPSRYLLLLMVKASEGERSTVTQLAERMQLTQSTVTELVTRAESAGLISREQSGEDARVFWLHLTADAQRRLSRAVSRTGRERHRLLALLNGAAEPQP